MAVMRSIMYVPGNNPKMVEKAPSIPADIQPGHKIFGKVIAAQITGAQK